MSDDFFNQPFSPAPSSGNRRAPPPPPAPPAGGPPSGGVPRRSSAAPPRSGGAPRSMNSMNQKSSASSFASAGSGSVSDSGGFYGNGNGNSNNYNYNTNTALNQSRGAPRPTGDYYATTTTLNNGPVSTTSAPAASFYNMNGGTAPAPAAPSPYGYSNTNTTASTPYGSSTNNSNLYASNDPNVVSQHAQPAPQEPTAPEGSEGEWFSSPHLNNPAPLSQTADYSNPYGGAPTTHQNDSMASTTGVNGMSGQLSGPMSSNSSAPAPAAFSGTILNPSTAASNGMNAMPACPYDPHEFDNEPPLLEELGINFTHIRTKSLAVLLPMKFASSLQQIDTNMMEDNDMAGPMAFALALGGQLLLCGKIHFGYIYGFCLFGCMATTLILNLMSPTTSISMWTVVSILGYSLLPVNFLAGLNIVYRIQLMGSIGVVLAALTIVWCTISSTRLFERGCGLRDQRYLVGYPNMLLYSAFVMITIF